MTNVFSDLNKVEELFRVLRPDKRFTHLEFERV